VEAIALTKRCRDSLARREHAVLGVSPFNGYFTSGRLLELIQWARAEFQEFHVFVPDQPTAYTLEALGYSAEKSVRKARRQSNYLHNKIRRALVGAGVPSADVERHVIGWAWLSESAEFRRRHDEVQALFGADADFRLECVQASRWVLQDRAHSGTLTDDVLRQAARYLLSEIPLFIDSVDILGVDSSVFCYHEVPAFISALYEGRFSLRVAPAQGFARVSATEGVQRSA
jgi:cyclo(L-tyrosyl-L-tyrosyl) synthase